MFIFIGTAPRTDMVAGLVERDPQGFILTGRDLLIDGKWPRTWNPDVRAIRSCSRRASRESLRRATSATDPANALRRRSAKDPPRSWLYIST